MGWIIALLALAAIISGIIYALTRSGKKTEP
jgi:hypothetical protein